MSRERVYLDYNASAPVRPQARAAMLQALDHAGNASSVHGEGRAARRAIEIAREALAASLGCAASGVTFVSGGSEANATVLSPRWKVGGEDVVFEHLFVSGTEHPSVLSGGRFARERVSVLPVDGQGRVRVEDLTERLAHCSGPVLVSVMAANNETGVVQPVGALADAVHAHGGYLHSDAVQAYGKMPMHLAMLGADAVSVSAHKIGGVQGAGAVVLRDGIAIPALMTGGGQENYRRAGTENVGAIAAFGAVASDMPAILEQLPAIRRMRDWFEKELRYMLPDSVVFGEDADRLGNTSCFAMPGIRAETAMIRFDLSGIAVSSGSACSSGKVSASHVLKAMGTQDGLAGGAVRASLGWATTEDDMSTFLQAVRAACKNQRPKGQTKAA